MARLDLIAPAERKREGQILREKWLAFKDRNGGISQDKFCADYSFNQGQLQRWFTGERQIPAHRLTLLAKLWGFDASEIRPAAAQIAREWAEATNASIRELQERWTQLSPSQIRQAIQFLDLLVRAGDRPEDGE